ncbi:hypothetical protein BCR41DRAFT_373801 [Lobosporangium transversale]|uniref:Uncharacterized protein n=1 Tax=Lobosporangium transversale TaxID=64571 RepID=A0A1Y2GEW0_9FUNG|nr:hypothetical protein BCR41DRAFT_373801 [Lobosporangium transversale]ORZ07026.1 hypothetical protein BCR41DRAFT_373801 [Lobosporangium transversale]|eukprot:XP_021877822.1 hypothetical protein BCR41DRAFT_373801 [Lobosporangium transversale]
MREKASFSQSHSLPPFLLIFVESGQNYPNMGMVSRFKSKKHLPSTRRVDVIGLSHEAKGKIIRYISLGARSRGVSSVYSWSLSLILSMLFGSFFSESYHFRLLRQQMRKMSQRKATGSLPGYPSRQFSVHPFFEFHAVSKWRPVTFISTKIRRNGGNE